MLRRQRERRERERERTSGLSQSVRFFSPLILFHVMGLVLRRRNGTLMRELTNMRRPDCILDRWRFRLRIEMLLAPSASFVSLLRLRASLPRTYDWLFSLIGANCLHLRPPSCCFDLWSTPTCASWLIRWALKRFPRTQPVIGTQQVYIRHTSIWHTDVHIWTRGLFQWRIQTLLPAAGSHGDFIVHGLYHRFEQGRCEVSLGSWNIQYND